MEKFIKKVWIELQGLIIKASLSPKDFLPKSPLILLRAVSANFASSAKTIFLVSLSIFMGQERGQPPDWQVGCPYGFLKTESERGIPLILISSKKDGI